MLVNNHWISEEIKEEIKVSSDKQKWKHDVQNIWDEAKVVLRQKFIAIQSYFRKQTRKISNNLILHLEHLGKEEKTKLKVSF